VTSYPAGTNSLIFRRAAAAAWTRKLEMTDAAGDHGQSAVSTHPLLQVSDVIATLSVRALLRHQL